ncbi:MAG TPA: DUF3795 domain-containing protein [Clostridiaceae bacterium]|jgi:hypothetical protein|nr:DUF3795 domain-containing protein [Clostridiaceae bacterium]
MGKIIAACGNDCSRCPRYTKAPYEKSSEELKQTAELWFKIGYRDHVVSNQEISCMGCQKDNWCRYKIVKCVRENNICNCGQCSQYPCENIKNCFEVTQSFEPFCREVCTIDEYNMLKKAFFEKKENLSVTKTTD